VKAQKNLNIYKILIKYFLQLKAIYVTYICIQNVMSKLNLKNSYKSQLKQKKTKKKYKIYWKLKKKIISSWWLLKTI